MEPAQPVDRTPAEPTPPPRAGAGEPALVEPASAAGASPGPAAADTGRGDVALADPASAAGESPVPPAGRDKVRSERSPKDMAISMLVLLIPIALLLAFYRGFLGGDQPATVDPAPALDQARAAQAFPVTRPAGLGPDWKTVSASYRSVEGGSNLRLGYLTPEGRGAQVVQSDVPPERLLPAELTAEGRPQGPTEVSGRSWQLYTARGNEQALVLLEPDRTVIVVGDARENELRQLAGALH
ncbi:DUF4245 domain-containing protein [Micromonospora olivasterospora]|uniref:DUF4245 domain-containing protein n=1 Tax=Micromonospora olivasterospora TaxID=1880 RepID=UPI001B869C39|nr:DUF4245 domain-containing protein [Micromonospora olivasterospora]